MFDLVWVRIFPQTSGVRTFSPTYNGVRFFFQHLYAMSDIFFQRRIFFVQILNCKIFSPQNQSGGYFF